MTGPLPSAPPDRRRPSVDVVVPAYNEAHVLGLSLPVLHGFLATTDLDWRIEVVDNASSDGTGAVARRLAGELDRVAVRSLPGKGRGGALRAAWSDSMADIVAYTDADLSTDLGALPVLVERIVAGADLAIASRLAAGAHRERGPLRDVLSRGYNVLLRAVLGVSFSDAQCGCKALRTDVARALLPLVDDDGWFFDTELLVLAERSGLVIADVPVHWVDDSDSRVQIVPTVVSDLRGVARLVRHRRRLPDRTADLSPIDGQQRWVAS